MLVEQGATPAIYRMVEPVLRRVRDKTIGVVR